jgi:inner membrane protein
VDNLCHTLVGATMAAAGGRRWTPLATPTLLIGANLPDVDVTCLLGGEVAGLAGRRGWTHGVLAMVVLPLLLTAAMLAWDRWRRRRRQPLAAPARPGPLLALAAISILSHPFLDWLNNYGMRWEMPFRDVWFYGDALFIADLWVWLGLGLAVVAGWRLARRGNPRAELPARLALAALCLYIAAMLAMTANAEQAARSGMQRAGFTVGRVMASPVALNPFRRQVVADAGDRYLLGDYDGWRKPAFVLRQATVPKGDRQPEAVAAARTRDGARFLHWARFPFFVVEPRGEAGGGGGGKGGAGAQGGALVWILDARYTVSTGRGFGSLAVQVPAASALPARSPAPGAPRGDGT